MTKRELNARHEDTLVLLEQAGPTSVTDINRVIRGYVTNTIQSLCERGLVKESPRAAGEIGWAVRYELTPDGHKMARHIIDRRSQIDAFAPRGVSLVSAPPDPPSRKRR